MTEQRWIDWFPKAGDIKPERYRYKYMNLDMNWTEGDEPGVPVDDYSLTKAKYQIPASVVTPAEDRPPWIDPQCKFRWGDRVKDKKGDVWFVNNPDTGPPWPVLVTKTLHTCHPHADFLLVSANFDVGDDYNIYREDDLTLFPEDLPKHFDDRILDADQPQEAVNQQPTRVPREIWVNHSYAGGYGLVWDSRLGAESAACDDCETLHFREVFPDDLTNLQYSPGG